MLLLTFSQFQVLLIRQWRGFRRMPGRSCGMRPSEKFSEDLRLLRERNARWKKKHRKKKSTHQQKEQLASRKFESAKFLWETHFFFPCKENGSIQVTFPSFLTFFSQIHHFSPQFSHNFCQELHRFFRHHAARELCCCGTTTRPHLRWFPSLLVNI